MTRFRRGSYSAEAKGGEPKWHIAVQDYKKGEIYRRYLALCGYEIKMPWGNGTQLSRAKRVDGPKCSKCIKKLTKTEEKS